MASGNINCPVGNTLFLSTAEQLCTPNINLKNNINSTLNIPLMFNPNLANLSTNNNPLEDHIETSITLNPNIIENSRPGLTQNAIFEFYQPSNTSKNTKNDAESVQNQSFNLTTMLPEVSPSVGLNNPDLLDLCKQSTIGNNPLLLATSKVNSTSEDSQPVNILDTSRHQPLENPIQLSIPLVPCYSQVDSSEGKSTTESKRVSEKIALKVPPRPTNKVSPPNIPLMFDITPENAAKIPELLVKPIITNQNDDPKQDNGVSPPTHITAAENSSKTSQPMFDFNSQNPTFNPYYYVPHRVQTEFPSVKNDSSFVEPSSSNQSHVPSPDYQHPLRMPLVYNEGSSAQMLQQAPNQSLSARPDYRVPLVLCTSETNAGAHNASFRSGLVPGMLGSRIPEELSISIDSSGEEGGHSWRPGLTNALSEDFFLPPSLHQFSGQEKFVRNSGQSHHDTKSYIDSQKAELNILRYEVMNARRRIIENKSATETLSGHLKEVLKFQNIAEMEKLTSENAQLRLECQCLCMEVDFYLKGQAPLGEVDEKFYKDSNEKAESSACEGSKPSVEDEEGDQWECHKCTFVNHPAIRCCEMCHVPRRTKRRTAAHPQYASDEACYCHPQKR